MAKKNLEIDMNDERINASMAHVTQFFSGVDTNAKEELKEEQKVQETEEFDIGVPPVEKFPVEPIEDVLQTIDKMNETGEMTGKPTGVMNSYAERNRIKERHQEGKRTKRMVLMVTPSLYNEIAWTAKETKLSMNEIITQAILEFLY